MSEQTNQQQRIPETYSLDEHFTKQAKYCPWRTRIHLCAINHNPCILANCGAIFMAQVFNSYQRKPEPT